MVGPVLDNALGMGHRLHPMTARTIARGRSENRLRLALSDSSPPRTTRNSETDKEIPTASLLGDDLHFASQESMTQRSSSEGWAVSLGRLLVLRSGWLGRLGVFRFAAPNLRW